MAYQVNCSYNTKWISVWKDVDGRDIIENPFNVRSTRIKAIKDRQDRPLGITQNCMCRNTNLNKNITYDNDCHVWTSCMFNTDFVSYIQGDYENHYSTNISFIIGSIAVMLLSSMTIPISYKMFKDSNSIYISL